MQICTAWDQEGRVAQRRKMELKRRIGEKDK